MKASKPELSATNYDITAPRADALVESLRGFGYSPQAAIADLIDNSISANAKNVWLEFVWDGKDSYITLQDDGSGMTEKQLVEAMRPGSQSPREIRNPSDLGRFGLGLKTASFSQCRRLIVRSQTEIGQVATRCWDLDYVTSTGEWRLLKTISTKSEAHLETRNHTTDGTVVLWECMDNIVGNAKSSDIKAHDAFLQIIHDVEHHIRVVFHRFLERRNQLSIWVNGTSITPWDPFLRNAPATQCLGEEVLRFHGQKVIVRPYVLPHHSKIDPRTHNIAAGIRGWNAQQGFYIYRNERLLVAGDWLGFFSKEEHYKLARIQIDIPNSMDDAWHIDVRKSKAQPPNALKDDLKRIAGVTRERAVSIYRHRGKVIAHTKSDALIFPWDRRIKHGKVYYQVNRDHPLVKDLLTMSEPQRRMFRSFLRLIEETVPIPLIALDHAERPEEQAVPFEGVPTKERLTVLIDVYHALRRNGVSDKAARERLLTMEPFLHYPELITSLDELLQEENYS